MKKLDIMTINKYQKRMTQHEKSINKIWKKIANETNQFIEKNPTRTMYSLQTVEYFSDSLCLKGAWISDRINGYMGTTHHPTYRRSLSKKIRKALGYTY